MKRGEGRGDKGGKEKEKWKREGRIVPHHSRFGFRKIFRAKINEEFMHSMYNCSIWIVRLEGRPYDGIRRRIRKIRSEATQFFCSLEGFAKTNFLSIQCCTGTYKQSRPPISASNVFFSARTFVRNDTVHQSRRDTWWTRHRKLWKWDTMCMTVGTPLMPNQIMFTFKLLNAYSRSNDELGTWAGDADPSTDKYHHARNIHYRKHVFRFYWIGLACFALSSTLSFIIG